MKTTDHEPLHVSIESGNGSTIKGAIYGKGGITIILSNMDTNMVEEWDPVIDKLLMSGYDVISYTYNKKENDCIYDLYDVMKFAEERNNKEKLILMGASRGGVISLKAAIESGSRRNIAAVIALSAPQVYEGVEFYSDMELGQIAIPVFLINSELDDGAADTKKMFSILKGKKEILICRGDCHGTYMFHDNREILLERIGNFLAGMQNY